MKDYCYLILNNGDSQKLKRRLVLLPQVYRITDHGYHLKVNTKGPLPEWRNITKIIVKDKTKHFDSKYWDFVMDSFRYATKKKHSNDVVNIMIHYICLLWGINEIKYLKYLVQELKKLKKKVKKNPHLAGQDWEIRNLAKAGLI